MILHHEDCYERRDTMDNKIMNESYNNPFPVAAVANFDNKNQNSLIVETSAIKKMKKIVEQWLHKDDEGITIAIQGEYGTGKTQLAIELQKYIQNSSGIKYHFICLDSPARSFLKMYRERFLSGIQKEQVIERLEECYTELVFNDLKDDELYGMIIERMHKKIKGTKLIEELGLSKSRYDRIFGDNLKRVTKSERFVPALQLLTVQQFENDIWEWFGGSEPSKALKERKVDFTIDSDTLALETIGVFAFLFGQQNHRLILFIDEMEKIMSNPTQTREDSLNALKKLFETVKETKSMLILCGLPDYYEVLPEDAKQRIGGEVKTRAITLGEMKKYISKANEISNKVVSCEPFTEQILKKILDISKGNIRMIIRLLYHAGDWYRENKLEIDEKAFCEVLKNAYVMSDISDVSTRVAEIVLEKGWLYEEKKELMHNGKKNIIDLWLPFVGGSEKKLDKGVEIYIAQNIVSNDDYQAVCERVCEKSDNYKLLIVEGFLTEKFGNLLKKKVFVIKYGVENFKEIFLKIIEGEKVKHEKELEQDNLAITNEKIEQLSRMLYRVSNEINEKFISKNEFYYFIEKVLDEQQGSFYDKINSNSEFYRVINEIQRLIDSTKRSSVYKCMRYEQGVLYFLREISYILYYMTEKPKKINIPFSHRNIIKGYRQLQAIVLHVRNILDFSIYDNLQPYVFLLEELFDSLKTQKSGNNNINNKGNVLHINNIHNNDFFEISNAIKQISQDFCAYVLIDKPELFDMYEDVFYGFYHLVYAGEADIIQKKENDIDLELIRIYYDLIRQYTRESEYFRIIYDLEPLFREYEMNLRRYMYE